MQKLFFGLGNAKLSVTIGTFSLPAGWTCPGANECLCKSDRLTGKLTDGSDTKFRCFAATGEARATSVRNARWRNFELLQAAKTVQEMADLINNSIPFGVSYIRLHPSGDFFNENYFKAWLNVAIANPAITFYAYTKSLGYLAKYKAKFPSNFKMTASKGGKFDALIAKHNLVSAEVVFSTEEARRKGLEIDHDDSLAIKNDKSFAILLHGTQPAKSLANEAWKVIMRTVGGYNANRQRGTQPVNHIEIAIK